MNGGNRFSIKLEKYYNITNKKEMIITMQELAIKPYKFFRWIGFSYSFQVRVTSEPKQLEDGWEYNMQMIAKVLNWLDFKLFIVKRYE
jgi:hypothetical protein